VADVEAGRPSALPTVLSLAAGKTLVCTAGTCQLFSAPESCVAAMSLLLHGILTIYCTVSASYRSQRLQMAECKSWPARRPRAWDWRRTLRWCRHWSGWQPSESSVQAALLPCGALWNNAAAA
jgi:hypothetical protein